MFDVLTIAAITDELAGTILDGKIQRLGLADSRTLTFEIYAGGRRRTLIASADDRDPRLLISASDPVIDVSLVTPLVLLLRKYARGGVIVGIEQPPLERIVRVSIAKRIANTRHSEREEISESDGMNEDGEDTDEIYGVESPTFVHLYIEIMGRHSNIILVDDEGRIMESVKHVSTKMSRVRPIAPRLKYSPPPFMKRPDPRRLTGDSVRELLVSAKDNQPVADWLVRSLRGVSPQIGREIAFLSTGSDEATIGDLRADASGEIARIARTIYEPLLTSDWHPRVYEDEEGLPITFSAFPFEHLRASSKNEIAVESMSAAAEQAGGGGPEAPGRHDARKRRTIESIHSVRERLASRLKSMRDEAERAAGGDQYRVWGDLIYAYLWQIQPGDSELLVDDVKIPLDSQLSAKENAQAYFERYRRGRDAGEQLPERILATETEIAYLDQIVLQIEQAENFPDIESLQIEWDRYRAQSQPGSKDKRATKRSAPARRLRPLIDDDGNAIYIGRSGSQNDEVTFAIAGPNDTWLHARGVPGSHVIVRWRNPAQDERDETIEAAARIAAFYSASRSSGQVEVDITRRRHVRKIKGAGPGMVTYRNERTIAVRPADESSLSSELTLASN
ncbi:MAG: Rqc2 family fibronectin-binding protein [Thermomicrobiales bacterium]